MTSFAETTLAQMRRVSTATFTTQMFRRGFRNVFMQGVRRLGPPARTWSAPPGRCDILALAPLSAKYFTTCAPQLARPNGGFPLTSASSVQISRISIGARPVFTKSRRMLKGFVLHLGEATMALSVIGAGLGRTGTLSLKLALERLGFGPCYHMRELLKQLDAHLPVWNRAADGAVVDWDTLYEGYSSAVDFPTAGFYRELSGHYPAAKVILTLRDSARWYESVKETILWPLTQPLPDHLSAWQAMLRKAVVNRIFEGNVQDREHVIAAYERHNADVKRAVAAERLLVYDVSEGWAPLCSFLGADVPDEAFPKVNTTEEFRDRILTVFARQGDAPVIQGPHGAL